MSKYLKYVIRNISPIRVADDSSSQMGQTSTMHYIPGSAIRGYVINSLAQKEYFESIRREVLGSTVRYMNAYPAIPGKDCVQELIPAPIGFYEDKTIAEGAKRITNVLFDDIDELKRAGIGDFIKIDTETIKYYRVSTGADLKIKIHVDRNKNQSVFRNEYITVGHTFIGYIAVENDEIAEYIKSVLCGTIMIGNARSAGLGKCEVLSCDYLEGSPYFTYQRDTSAFVSVCMMLLSDAVMRDSVTGEYCGLDMKNLEDRLGVKNLRISRCATSSVDIRGFNRMWGVKVPSVPMYKKGSVFLLSFDGEMTRDRMDRVAESGIGVRIGEGFGRVIFLKDYEKVTMKAEGTESLITVGEIKGDKETDKKVLNIAARGYYRNLFHNKLEEYIVTKGFERGKVFTSKLGKMTAFTTTYKFDFEEAKRRIDGYLDNEEKKQKNMRIQKDIRPNVANLSGFVRSVLNCTQAEFEEMLGITTKNKGQVMGIPLSELFSDNELGMMRLEFLTELLRFDNKNKEM